MSEHAFQPAGAAYLPYEIEAEAVDRFREACELLDRDPGNALSILIGMFVVHALGHAEIVLRPMPVDGQSEEASVLSFDDVTSCYLASEQPVH